jgi:hypothetical protein
MAKIKKKTSAQQKSIHLKDVQSLDKNELLDKFFWLIIPVMTVIYFISSKYSVGFYQDDEVGQYINMVQFWGDPFIILGNYPKPGYKIFTVIPALFGYNTVLIFNSLIAAVTVYMTYVLIKVYNIRYAFFGAVLLAFQPLFFDLSFRSYAEIFTALCMVIFLILFRKEKYFLSGLMLGYIFTIRQETALLILIMAVIFFRRKEWTAIFAMGIFPLVYNLLGYLKTGQILFIYEEMQQVAGLNYQGQGLFHYFKVYIFIIGPVALSLFLAGFFGFFADLNKYKEYIRQYYIFYIIFVTVFIIQMMTMFNDGPNPGNWRYLLHISPVAALFATLGLNNLADAKYRKTSLIIISIFAFITLVFLSKETDGFRMLESSEYGKFFFIAGLLVITFLFSRQRVNQYLNQISVAILLLAIVSLFFMFKPKQLSPENQAVKQVSEYIQSLGIENKNVFTSHSFVMFFSDEMFRKNTERFMFLQRKNVDEHAKPGDIIIWESHYGGREELGYDIEFEDLQNNPDYNLLEEIVSTDRRFAAYVFEKVN